jgi:thiamine kinase-like enzyme
MAEALSWESEADQKGHAALDFASMRSAVAATEELCARVSSPVVFSHNDLLCGNIMALGVPCGTELGACTERLRVQFIDFEYSNRSFRGFDWGACL